MSSSSRKITEHEQSYQRQAEILRNNIFQWDQVLTTTGEEWPEKMGRFNAALNQVMNMNKEIDPIFDHFVYAPRKSTANPQDIPLFLSTRVLLGDKEDQLTCTKNVDDGVEKRSSCLRRERDMALLESVEGSFPCSMLTDQLQRIDEISNQVIQDYENHMERFG
jgi:hypothetical protein